MKYVSSRLTRAFLLVVGAALVFEAEGLQADPWALIGWYIHTDISSWFPIHIVVTPIEVTLLIIIALWSLRNRRLKAVLAFQPGSLLTPLLCFMGMLAFGVLYGQARGGGNLNFALWEVRGFLMLAVSYCVVGMLIHSERDLNALVWVILIAAMGLSVENILRSIALSSVLQGNDLAFDHVDSVVLAFAFTLCVCLLAFGGTRRQRRFALALMPLIIISLELMRRRAAFATLAIALVIVVIFLLRLRPNMFWRVIPPIAILLTIYLIIFWHNTSIFGQPARAISSQFSPDPRDLASNLYRYAERFDIIFNIRTAPLTGLGFGQQFTFFLQLPDVGSGWPFWRYTTHNAILWVWMKDGVLGFLAFMTLLGRGVYDGARAMATQREEWTLVAQLRARLNSRKANERLWERAAALATMLLRPTIAEDNARLAQMPSRALGLNVPMWERTDHLRAVTARRSGSVALLVAGVALIPMQVSFSYVDLGLTSPRDMLLLGLMLGIIARAPQLLDLRMDPRRGAARRPQSAPIVRPTQPPQPAQAPTQAPTQAPVMPTFLPRAVRQTSRPLTRTLSNEQVLDVVRELTTGGPRSRPLSRTTGAPSSSLRPISRPLSRPISRPLTRATTPRPLTAAERADAAPPTNEPTPPTASKDAPDTRDTQQWQPRQPTPSADATPIAATIRRDERPLPWEKR